MPAPQFQRKLPSDTFFVYKLDSKALKNLLGCDPAALLLFLSCAIKITDGSDLEARENPQRVQTKEKETKNGGTLRCVISSAKAGF